MRGAGQLDQAAGSVVVHARPDRAYPHATPVYGSGTSERGIPTPDSSIRGWPAQLAQWVILLGALGLLIAGVKWWDRHRAPEPSPQGVSAASVTAAGD